MNQLLKTETWLGGLQWFFFIFANIVVIPITVGEAFQLNQEKVVFILQLSFVVTGLACMAQALIGHGRPILEGQSGLWWGLVLTLATTASAQGMSIDELGGSLAVGIIISGLVTILIGMTGVGSRIAPLFNDSVMGVFMLLLGFTLIHIFLKGMLGIPFGLNEEQSLLIDVPVALLAILIALLVIVVSLKSPARVRSYALLIGIVIGWILFVIVFGKSDLSQKSNFHFTLFPLGKPIWNIGIVLTVVLAGLLNMSNTFGSLKGTDDMYEKPATSRQYGKTFSITGFATIAAGVFGLVPYAPYVSSIGFLKQTNIWSRAPFILGGFLFFLMGVIPVIGAFFAQIPLSIGSAVLFVAYLQLFNSSLDFFRRVKVNTLNVYRVAIPLFTGTVIMMLPAVAFESLPALIRPFLSNGLLVGVILAIVLENIINWDRIVG